MLSKRSEISQIDSSAQLLTCLKKKLICQPPILLRGELRQSFATCCQNTIYKYRISENYPNVINHIRMYYHYYTLLVKSKMSLKHNKMYINVNTNVWMPYVDAKLAIDMQTKWSVSITLSNYQLHIKHSHLDKWRGLCCLGWWFLNLPG